jgi:Na+/melibiose symporter-like transporter
MSIIETHITNLIDGLLVFYLCSKLGVIKAFAKKLFSYLLLVASSAYIITMLRKSFDKQQLVIIIIVLAIAFVVANNKKDTVATL